LCQDGPVSKLTSPQIAAAGLAGWAFLINGLQTRLRTADFATGLRLVNAIGAAAEAQNHHPDLGLRYTHVDVWLTSHDTGGVTERDVRLARTITALAEEAGVALEAETVARIELALDSPAWATVSPFWQAVLSLKGEQEITDPYGALPTVWFQESGAVEPRQRWHLDVWVDAAQVPARIEAARAAGGTVVSDAAAPHFWVLADPEGNQVCLCTTQERA
jgi:4a-hydroxytetrahydrobiopterin dehydratase